MTITVHVRSVYGVQQVYPVCKHASLFAKIAGTKTLQPHTLHCIEQLGYTIVPMAIAPILPARI